MSRRRNSSSVISILTGTQQKSKVARTAQNALGRQVSYYRDEWLSLKTKLYDGNMLRVSAQRRMKIRDSYLKRSMSGKMKMKSALVKDDVQVLNVRLSVNPQVYAIVPQTLKSNTPGRPVHDRSVAERRRHLERGGARAGADDRGGRHLAGAALGIRSIAEEDGMSSRAKSTWIVAGVLVALIMGVALLMTFTGGAAAAKFTTREIWSQAMPNMQSMKIIDLSGDGQNDLFMQNEIQFQDYRRERQGTAGRELQSAGGNDDGRCERRWRGGCSGLCAGW